MAAPLAPSHCRRRPSPPPEPVDHRRRQSPPPNPDHHALPSRTHLDLGKPRKQKRKRKKNRNLKRRKPRPPVEVYYMMLGMDPKGKPLSNAHCAEQPAITDELDLDLMTVSD